MTVEYKFADGTVSEVEVSEEIGTYIMDSRRKENSANVLDCLTETQRRRMLLFIEGWSFRNIAEQEGTNHKSVEESIKAAQKKIQKFLKNTPTK